MVYVLRVIFGYWGNIPNRNPYDLLLHHPVILPIWVLLKIDLEKLH